MSESQIVDFSIDVYYIDSKFERCAMCMTFTEAISYMEVPDFSVVMLTTAGESLVLPDYQLVSDDMKSWLNCCPAIKSYSEDEIVVETIFNLVDLAYILWDDLPSKDIVKYSSEFTVENDNLPLAERLGKIYNRMQQCVN